MSDMLQRIPLHLSKVSVKRKKSLRQETGYLSSLFRLLRREFSQFSREGQLLFLKKDGMQSRFEQNRDTPIIQ
jgi:exonuclease V gamma subunit